MEKMRPATLNDEQSALRNVGERPPPQQSLGEDLLGKGGAFLFITLLSVGVGVLFSLMWHSCHPNGPMTPDQLKRELQANGMLAENGNLASTGKGADADQGVAGGGSPAAMAASGGAGKSEAAQAAGVGSPQSASAAENGKVA